MTQCDHFILGRKTRIIILSVCSCGSREICHIYNTVWSSSPLALLLALLKPAGITSRSKRCHGQVSGSWVFVYITVFCQAVAGKMFLGNPDCKHTHINTRPAVYTNWFPHISNTVNKSPHRQCGPHTHTDTRTNTAFRKLSKTRPIWLQNCLAKQEGFDPYYREAGQTRQRVMVLDKL